MSSTIPVAKAKDSDAVNPDVAFSLHTMEDDLAHPTAAPASPVKPAQPILPKPVIVTPPAAPAPAAPTIQISSTHPSEEASSKSSLEALFGEKQSAQTTLQPKKSFFDETAFEEAQAKKTPAIAQNMPPEAKNTPSSLDTAPRQTIAFEPSKPAVPKPEIPANAFAHTNHTVLSSAPLTSNTFSPNKAPKQPPMTLGATPSMTLPHWLIKTGVGIFVLLLLGGGAWYWQQSGSIIPPDPEEVIATPKTPTPATPETPAPVTPADNSPFDLQNANKLTVAIATSTPESFRASLISIAQKIKDANIQQPVEFQIVDSNNAPVSFAVWSAWMKIAFPANVMATLDTPFSLFLYNDQDYVRVGLKITGKNPAQAKTQLAKAEASLLKILAPLYFNSTQTAPDAAAFATGSYHGIATRYFNFATPDAPFVTGLSLDYAIFNQYILFGTSKQTLRVMLDALNPTN